MAYYESEVQDKLNEHIGNLGKNEKIHKTSSSVKFINIAISANYLLTYFQSVIWRQCLEQVLDGADNPLLEEEFERLRGLVEAQIYVPVNDMKRKTGIDVPKMSILTTYHTKEALSYGNPHPLNTNPIPFFIGPVILLYWCGETPSKDFEEVTKIPCKMLADELTLDKSRMAVINEVPWGKINRVVVSQLAKSEGAAKIPEKINDLKRK